MIIYPKQDTLKVSKPESDEGTHVQQLIIDSLVTDTNKFRKQVIQPPAISQHFHSEEPLIHLKKEINTDTIRSDSFTKNDIYKPFNLFSNISNSDSSIVNPSKKEFSYSEKKITSEYTAPIPLNKHKTLQKGWVLGIGLFSAIVFIIVRVYFQKYLSNIVTSLINIQIAEKLMREKNVLVRRVFILLNINFAVSTTLFIYILAERINLKLLFNGQFNRYLYLFIIFVGILLFRYIFILFIGKVFDSMRLFREYLHNTYLINKNLGLYLIPLVISVFYLQKPFADIVFYIAIVLVSISLLYKYLRAIQIIIKYNVFLFYSILYLCTLEIIPTLVGFKFVLSLR